MSGWHLRKASDGYDARLLEAIDRKAFEARALRDWVQALVAWIVGTP